jgi:hypothetical protein
MSGDLSEPTVVDDVPVRLARVIRATLREWLDTGRAKDAVQVNSGAARGGCCSDFAAAVIENLGGVLAVDRLGLETLGIDSFQLSDEDDLAGRPLDRELLERHWPKVVPPDGLDWDDLNRLSEDAGFSGGTHTWLCSNGRHYDAETPEVWRTFLRCRFFSALSHPGLSSAGRALLSEPERGIELLEFTVSARRVS